MNRAIIGIIGVGLLSVAAVSCGSRESRKADSATVDSVARVFEIQRLEPLLVAYPTMDNEARTEAVDSLYTGLRAMTDFFGASQLLRGAIDWSQPIDSVIGRFATTDIVRIFGSDVMTRIPDISDIERRTGLTVARLSEDYPDVAGLRFYTFISPYSARGFQADSVFMIGLNHYLGSDYPGYESFPDYLKRTAVASAIPYDVARALVTTRFPYTDDDNTTVLSRLIYEGAVVASQMQSVPEADLGEALGYSAEQLAWMKENESKAWEALINRNMLYDRDATLADRLTTPSPATTVLNPDMPGGGGRYIGYRIVDKYLKENPSASVKELLTPSYYSGQAVDILRKSGYTGR